MYRMYIFISESCSLHTQIILALAYFKILTVKKKSGEINIYILHNVHKLTKMRQENLYATQKRFEIRK